MNSYSMELIEVPDGYSTIDTHLPNWNLSRVEWLFYGYLTVILGVFSVIIILFVNICSIHLFAIGALLFIFNLFWTKYSIFLFSCHILER